MGSLQTASEIKGDITCVFGATKSGRTHQIIKRILARPTVETDKVLWVTFGNLNFEGKARPDWVAGQMETWDAFNTEIYTPLVKRSLVVGEHIFSPNIIVVEELDIAGQYYYAERMKKLEAKYAQQTFGEVGPKLRETIAVLKSRCDAFFFSLTTRDKFDVGGSPTTVFNTNEDSVRKTLTMASNLVYTTVKTKRETTGVAAAQQYYVQTNSSLAIQFIQGEKA